MVANRNILISGAGITGLTLAYWLDRNGFSPTMVERRPNLDNRGYLIDFYGSGYDVTEKMGLTETLQATDNRYGFEKLNFVDGRGRVRAKLDVEKFRGLLHHRYVSVMRGDLENALYTTIQDRCPIRFGTSIQQLVAGPDQVSVALSDGTQADYDLVIGADGIHSNVRSLVWGDEDQFSRFLGFYVACSVIENFFDQPKVVYGYFEPNLQTTVYTIGDGKLATFFGFRSAPLAARTREERLAVLAQRVGHGGWVLPKLLERTQTASDFFFDAAAQIEMETWHRGRVALAGDACQCLTLLAGQGASLGMAGAYWLAEELRRAEGDYRAAFAAYQERLRPEIVRRQKDARGLAGSFVPRNKLEIALTYLMLHVAFWPGVGNLFARQIGVGSLIK